MSSVLSLLGIARKAGRIQLGMDPVKEAMASGICSLVCIANDLSGKSKKEILFVCSKYSVEVYDVGTDMDEIKRALGKRSGIIAVCDEGFAKKIRTTQNRVQ